MGRSLDTSLKKPRVLVVEDQDDTREMYMEYLAYLGFDVEGAVNGRDAVRKAITQRRSLIVMDLAMPVMDGWEAMRILRADPRTRAIPIVVLTGQAQADLLTRAKEVGATEIITKPCLPAQLGRVVVSTLAHATAAAATAPPALSKHAT